MLQNKLKLNDSKTEFLQFLPSTPKTIPQENHTLKITIGNNAITPNEIAKNLEVLIDDRMMLDNHVKSVCKAANFQLYRLSRIRKYLTPETLCIAVHAFISSRIDYCNGVLVGLPQSSISKLQHIMNCAAHLITGTKKSEHITLVLKSLHWLPVHYRIQFKIICLVFKARHGQAPDTYPILLSTMFPHSH